MISGLHLVPYCRPILTKPESSQHVLVNKTHIYFTRIRPIIRRCFMRPGRQTLRHLSFFENFRNVFNPLNPELNPICYLLALLGAHHFLHVSRIRVKLLTFRLLSYIYIYIERERERERAPILDVSRSHTTTQHSR